MLSKFFALLYVLLVVVQKLYEKFLKFFILISSVSSPVNCEVDGGFCSFAGEAAVIFIVLLFSFALGHCYSGKQIPLLR